MKKIFPILLCLSLLLPGQSYSQHNNSELPTSINEDGAAPHGSAVLDLQATAKGLLIPRLSLAARALIDTPVDGLLIYQTDNLPGFYYFNGTDWVAVGGGGADADWLKPDNTPASSIIDHIYTNGMVGIGIATPQNALHVAGSIRIADGSQGPGKVLTSDAGGLASWQLSTPGTTYLIDNDNDTKIQVEETNDEDMIRFDLGAIEHFIMKGPRLEVMNSGSSVFIGEGAGANDDLSNNFNVAIGNSALSANTTGSYNTANGANALKFNTTGSDNTANGRSALGLNTTGASNTANGSGALSSNTTGSNNTAHGVSALKFNTIGYSNTASGRDALRLNTTGASNTANGSGALYFNTTGSDNTASGRNALRLNDTGNDNTANGSGALYSNTTGNDNTASGRDALRLNDTGNDNTANGSGALYSNTSGINNTASGRNALRLNDTGNDNTANGSGALYSNTTGYGNTANGFQALLNNITGYDNTANGTQTLYSNTEGYGNTANGIQALFFNTTGNENTAIGYLAMQNTTTGNENTANGIGALYSNTTGSNNTANGAYALFNNTTGSYNTAVGREANAAWDDLTNSTGIGYGAICVNSNVVRIGNISVGSIGGYANWTNISDARFKSNVNEDVKGLEFIKTLRPVTYNLRLDKIDDFYAEHYNKRDSSGLLQKSEKNHIRYSGFMAQEVEAAAKQTGYDFSGVDAPKNDKGFYGLRYAEFVVPLVKGMQEQQEMIEAQSAQIVGQGRQIEAQATEINTLKAQLGEIEELKMLIRQMQQQLREKE